MLTAPERQRVLSDATFVDIPAFDVLGKAGARQTHACFPTTCMISLMPQHTSGNGFEVGLIGFEGVLGAGGALGVPTLAFDAVVQGSGQAWRIGVSALARHVAASPVLGDVLTRYLYVQLAQMGGRAVCSRFHSLQQRLARCLLMSEDRLRSPDLLMTHDSLSHILGARRAGVSVAAGVLQTQGLIRYSRGHIVVLDRAGLLASSCACYAQDVATYDKFMRVSPGKHYKTNSKQ